MRIQIIGWAGVLHSYSIVAENYVKGLILNGINQSDMYFTEHEYFNKSWKKVKKSVFDNMKSVPKETPEQFFDMTLRFTYPYDFRADPKAKITIVFVTCEMDCINDAVDSSDIMDNVWILTPSVYSKRGIVNSGFPETRILVVPHSYEYTPSKAKSDANSALRQKYKIPKDNYVYFHNSAITMNKNVSMIVRSFEMIYATNNNVTLLVKGLDETYSSMNKFNETIQLMQLNKTPLQCINNIIYIGGNMDDESVSELYETCDCYVAPFMAEGFNLPVLEALCHGKQVICSKHGPPDEFSQNDILFIDTQIVQTHDSVNINGNSVMKKCLQPNFSDLMRLMVLVPMMKNSIDKQQYASRYSHRTIGKLLFDNIMNVMSVKYLSIMPAITIWVADNKPEKVRQIIDNVRVYCGDTQIYVGGMENVGDNMVDGKNVIYTKITDDDLMQNDPCKSRDDMLLDVIMSKNKLTYAIGPITGDMILLGDPRGKSKNAMNNITTMNYKNYTHKWTTSHDGIKRLYILDEKTKRYERVMKMTNVNMEDPNIYIKEDKTKETIEKFLGGVDNAVITVGAFKKYERIVRCAPVTMLFNENDVVDITATEQLFKSKIFVYPESLEYFFGKLYKYCRTPFTLYTITCNFIANGEHIKYDTNKYIVKCEQFKYDTATL